MNGKNIKTGTVHAARADRYNGIDGLFQSCSKINVRNVAFLDETDEQITCSKCLKAAPAPTAAKIEASDITPAMRKVITRLAGRGWVSWRELGVGNATVAKMVKLGLLESRGSETEFRTV